MSATKRGALAFLIEKVIRSRIYESLYWKEQCFALNAESIIDRAVACQAIGGVYERQTPTPFMCLTLKLLQLQPEKEILLEYLLAEEFKYLRALAAFYIRLTFRSMEIYEILEPLMSDYKKLRIRHDGGYSLTYFDEFIDELLTKERVCDIILPRLTQRSVLEETEGLPPRKSLLDDDPREGKNGHENGDGSDVEMSPSAKRRRVSAGSRGSRDSSPDLRRGRRRSGSAMSEDSDDDRDRYLSRSPSRSRSRSRSGSAGSRGRYLSRSRSVSPDRAMEALIAEERIEGDV